MAEAIVGTSGAGGQNFLVINPDGSINTTGGGGGAGGDVFVVSGNAWDGVGSVLDVQGTDPWITLGSTQITNPAIVGSLATQGVLGSVAISTSPLPISGTQLNIVVGNVPTSASTVGAASTQLVAVNASRKGIIITNTTSNADANLAVGQTAVINTGIFIGRNGGNLVLDKTLMSTEVINFIRTGGTNVTLEFQEFE